MIGQRASGRSGAGFELRALFTDLAHGGDMAPAATEPSGAEHIFSGQAGSREHGTLVRVELRWAETDRRVREVRYRAFGCPYTLAACEWLARALSGRELSALTGRGVSEAVGTAADWCRTLGIPPGRLGRLLVIEDALNAALAAANAPRAAMPIAVADTP